MKKPCLSFRANPPAQAKRISCILFAAAISLTLAPAWATETAERGAASPPPKRTSSKGGYLQTLGPAPLRILSPDLQTPAVQLPPLAMSDPPPVPETADAATNLPAPLRASGPPADFVPADDIPFYGPPAPDALGQPPPDPTLSMPSSDVIITPQMLVQFFKPVGSNCIGGAWSVPVFVAPSPPTQTRPSTATYISQ